MASVVGSSEGIKILIKAGSNIEATNKEGYTALVVAYLQRNIEAMETLIISGAKFEKNDLIPFLYQDLSIMSNRIEMREMFRTLKDNKDEELVELDKLNNLFPEVPEVGINLNKLEDLPGNNFEYPIEA